MNILLTGAGGFLGQACLDIFGKYDFKLMAVSSQKELLERKYKNYSTLEFYSNEELSQEFLQSKNPDVWVNCAFPRATDGVHLAEGLDYIHSILKMLPGSTKVVIDVSSQSMYGGKRNKAVSELEKLNLETTYSVAKYGIEQLMNAYCQQIVCVHLRMASLIGPGFEQRVVNKLIGKAIAGNQIQVQGCGNEQKFGFMDVRDAADGILQMIQTIYENEYNKEKFSGVYNLGSEKSYSLLEIVKTIKEVGEEYNIDVRYSCDEHVRVDYLSSELNCEKFMNMFHWMPQYTIKDTIRYIYEKNLSIDKNYF